MAHFRHYFWPILWSFLGIMAYAVLLLLNPTAREVSRDTAAILFSIFSTPFILETTCALIGVFILLAINHWRLGKEGDGWVYMATQENEDQESGAISAQRLQGIIFKDMPLALDQESTTIGILEGYLDLGMAAQALKEMQEQNDLTDDVSTAALKIRILAANIDTEPALLMLKQSLERFPQAQEPLLQAVRDTVNWLHTHLPNHSATAIWESQIKEFRRE